jgi:ubiquinone biosynthesis protein Coq4
VMATIDIDDDDPKIQTVLRFSSVLGLHENYLRELAALAQNKLKWLAADVARENLLSITGKKLDISEDAFLLPFKEHPDPVVSARYEALGQLPKGTLGRTFFEFYRQNGFAFPGNPDGLNPEFATPHDSTHVLSGYDTSPQGELLVSTFTAGMHPEEPMSGHILPVIMTWHMGVELVKFTGKFTGGLDPEKFWVAWTRGGEVTTDTFARDWDFWHEVERPLEQVRADYHVPPLDPGHAASGEVPDWYHPVA